MRMLLVGLFVAGCANDVSKDGVDPPVEPPPGSGPMCTEACGENMPPELPRGDPIEFMGVAVDNFRGFFEPVGVEVWGDRFAMCTGVRGVTIYSAADGCCASLEASLIPEPSRSYPRCQHVRIVDNVAYVSNHGDEISPEPFVTVIDVNDLTDAPTLDTYFGDGETSFEGVEVVDRTLYVAQHEKGLAVLRIEDDGRITPVNVITDGLENAWLPKADAAAGLLYVADAQGGLAVFSIADPMLPTLISKVPTNGTLKDVAFVDGFVYGAAGTAGLEVYDVQDPANGTLLARLDTPGSALGIDTNGRKVVVADWNDLQVYDIADPAAPVLVGHQKAYTRDGRPSALGRILDVAVSGDMIIMGEWEAPQTHRLVDGVAAPDLFTPSTIEFLRTEVGQVSSTSLVMENVGQQTLNVESVGVQPPFSIELSKTEIEAGGRALATVTFTPTDDMRAEDTVTIVSDDPDEGTLGVSLKGNLPGLRTGDQAPDVRFVDLDGFEHRLSDFQGGPILLAYFATF